MLWTLVLSIKFLSFLIAVKLPVKLANFPKQALDACKIAFHRIFSLIDVFYGIIRMYCMEKKNLSLLKTDLTGVIFVLDLSKNDGNFYSYSEFSDFFLKWILQSGFLYEWFINSVSPKRLHLIWSNCYSSSKCEM